MEKLIEDATAEIKRLEEELRLTMLNNDAEKLDELLDESLTFVIPNGQIITKAMDLDGYKSNIQTIEKLEPLEQTIQIHDNFAVVTVKTQTKGTYNKIDASGQYRYLRIWKKINNSWKIVAGSLAQIS